MVGIELLGQLRIDFSRFSRITLPILIFEESVDILSINISYQYIEHKQKVEWDSTRLVEATEADVQLVVCIHKTGFFCVSSTKCNVHPIHLKYFTQPLVTKDSGTIDKNVNANVSYL